jgi:Raf kinase inhibitor-like YbhB/YbcL family protein
LRTIGIAGVGLLAASVAAGLAAPSAAAQTLKVRVDTIKNGGVIPPQYAFCIPDGQGHAGPGLNKSPRISWSKGPHGTKSYAVMVYDTDSPKEQREKMNQDGMTLTAAVPRQTFYHLVLVDIPPRATLLPEAAESDARVPHGKSTPAKVGVHGLNSFTMAFAANEQLKGQYYGYDGPCSPWNDENTHHYHFMVYALSVESLGLSGGFDGAAATAALEGKVLAKGELLGLYSTNPAVIAKLPK